jgi:hypothetical protein
MRPEGNGVDLYRCIALDSEVSDGCVSVAVNKSARREFEQDAIGKNVSKQRRISIISGSGPVQNKLCLIFRVHPPAPRIQVFERSGADGLRAEEHQ